jgi:hypothetical protein
MKRLLFFLLLATAFSRSALADTPRTGFIRKAGTVTLDANGSRLVFTNASDGRLSFALTWISGKSLDTIAMSKEGFFKKDGWFVYVESPTRIWMFDGVRQLDLVTHSEAHNGRYSVTTKGIFETCPQAVWDAVPESVRRFLHDKTTQIRG